jgi:hypothetical protein
MWIADPRPVKRVEGFTPILRPKKHPVSSPQNRMDQNLFEIPYFKRMNLNIHKSQPF